MDQPPLSFVEMIKKKKLPLSKDGIVPLEFEDTCLCPPIG